MRQQNTSLDKSHEHTYLLQEGASINLQKESIGFDLASQKLPVLNTITKQKDSSAAMNSHIPYKELEVAHERSEKAQKFDRRQFDPARRRASRSATASSTPSSRKSSTRSRAESPQSSSELYVGERIRVDRAWRSKYSLITY